MRYVFNLWYQHNALQILYLEIVWPLENLLFLLPKQQS